MLKDLVYWSPLGKSDHSILAFNFNCYTLGNSRWQQKYNFNKGDFNSIRDNLKIDWKSKLDPLVSVEEKWNFIKKYF